MSAAAQPALSILMPVYNEVATLRDAVARTLAARLPASFELVIVDDGSSDGSRELLDELAADPRVRAQHHERNMGKGAAIRSALALARGEFAAVLDADLEYDPADLALLLRPLLDGRANVVLGVRAFDGFTSHSFLYVLGNRGVTLAANVLFNVYLRDLMSCQKMMRTSLFRSLELREHGFAIEAEIVARVLQRGERVYETPVSYIARSAADGKKLTWVDGVRVVRTLLRCRIQRG
jgi:glycosyltransferase involved in cell wall biosynthesis